MGWFGDTGRWVGRTIGKLWHKTVDVWHMISPIVNTVAKEFARQVPAIGIDIIKDVISEYDVKDYTNATKRKKALAEIRSRLEMESIFTLDRWINFGIELFLNAMREEDVG